MKWFKRGQTVHKGEDTYKVQGGAGNGSLLVKDIKTGKTRTVYEGLPTGNSTLRISDYQVKNPARRPSTPSRSSGVRPGYGIHKLLPDKHFERSVQ